MPLFSYASSKPIIVAVLDSGIDVTHLEFENHLWIPQNLQAFNIEDDHPDGHGTHVAGIILGLYKKWPNNEHIKLMPFKMNLADPGLSLLRALEEAQRLGVSIFHLSYVQPEIRIPTSEAIRFMTQEERNQKLPWIEAFYRQKIIIHSIEDFSIWYQGYLTDCKEHWQRAMEKIKTLQDTMLIITSVGNNNRNLNEIALEPTTLSSTNVISVMNLDHRYYRYSDPTYGSDYGSQKVLISAIGENVRSTVPRSVSKTGWLELWGASQAAPKITHECANIALALQKQHIPLTPERIKEALLNSLPTSQLLKQYTITGKYLPE